MARRHAWVPAVMGASEAGAKAYVRAGLGALQLGDEAILHVRDVDLDVRDMRVTRQPSTASAAPAPPAASAATRP